MYVGIDVSKALLDLAVHPSGGTWQIEFVASLDLLELPAQRAGWDRPPQVVLSS